MFNPTRISHERAHLLVDAFTTLLAAVTTTDVRNTPIPLLPILSNAASTQLLSTWNPEQAYAIGEVANGGNLSYYLFLFYFEVN